jgi:hypothetical protein
MRAAEMREWPRARAVNRRCDDPDTFTRPFTAESVLVRATSRMFEYACHEGYYSMLSPPGQRLAPVNGLRAGGRPGSS